MSDFRPTPFGEPPFSGAPGGPTQPHWDAEHFRRHTLGRNLHDSAKKAFGVYGELDELYVSMSYL